MAPVPALSAWAAQTIAAPRQWPRPGLCQRPLCPLPVTAPPTRSPHGWCRRSSSGSSISRRAPSVLGGGAGAWGGGRVPRHWLAGQRVTFTGAGSHCIPTPPTSPSSQACGNDSNTTHFTECVSENALLGLAPGARRNKPGGDSRRHRPGAANACPGEGGTGRPWAQATRWAGCPAAGGPAGPPCPPGPPGTTGAALH